MADKKEQPIIDEAEYKMPEDPYAQVEETPVAPPAEDHSSKLGVILAVLIVILVLILAGLYLWGTTLKNSTPETAPVVDTESTRPTPEENNEPESENAEAEVETAAVVSTSDEIDDIEADLEATLNLEELDAELDAIEAEFDNL